MLDRNAGLGIKADLTNLFNTVDVVVAQPDTYNHKVSLIYTRLDELNKHYEEEEVDMTSAFFSRQKSK